MLVAATVVRLTSKVAQVRQMLHLLGLLVRLTRRLSAALVRRTRLLEHRHLSRVAILRVAQLGTPSLGRAQGPHVVSVHHAVASLVLPASQQSLALERAHAAVLFAPLGILARRLACLTPTSGSPRLAQRTLNKHAGVQTHGHRLVSVHRHDNLVVAQEPLVRHHLILQRRTEPPRRPNSIVVPLPRRVRHVPVDTFVAVVDKGRTQPRPRQKLVAFHNDPALRRPDHPDLAVLGLRHLQHWRQHTRVLAQPVQLGGEATVAVVHAAPVSVPRDRNRVAGRAAGRAPPQAH
mmetsp:Transcript_5062/g.16321  ORF Transcript_5062/g.16321 Transcript_5062/m.16321 type:complete len:291 (+) Transcript_5062:597-1469(+)